MALVLFCIGFAANAQTARIKGIILDKNNNPVEGVNINYQDKGTTTNVNGFYVLSIPANKQIALVFTHVSLKKSTLKLELKPNEDFEYNFIMSDSEETLPEVIVTAGNRKRVEGITSIEPAVIRTIPGANAGGENILK